MNTRAALRSAAPVIAHYSGIGKALAVRYRGPGVIFVLHSTVASSDSCLEDLRCPIDTLAQTLVWLKRSGFAFVSLDEAVARLDDPGCGRFCVFTFDDGYADNLTQALPLMEQFAAPFTVYVSTGMMTGEIDAWWLGLAALINATDRIVLPNIGVPFECRDRPAKKRAYDEIARRIHRDYATLAPVKAAIAAAGIDWQALARREALSIEQLRRLAASPLVTIGAHGERHINLARASAEEAKRDMIASRRRLEELIDEEVVHFAYPFGNANACGPREAAIAQAAGFRTAVTTRRGTLFPEHLDDLYALPREPLSGSDTAATLQCKVRGLHRAFESKLGDPVARM